MSVNHELRASWLKALRSGDYQQGRARLRRGDTFCCLGVLCDVKDPSGWYEYNGMHKFGGDEYSLSVLLRREVGINIVDMQSLIAMNDSKLQSFNTIADVLEQRIFPNADK